jgi:hypothetical protein
LAKLIVVGVDENWEESVQIGERFWMLEAPAVISPKNSKTQFDGRRMFGHADVCTMQIWN